MDHITRRARRGAHVIFAAVLAVVLTACGSGSAGKDAANKRISVGNFPNTLLTLPLGVAHGEKFFADEGLDVQIIPATGGPQLLAAMLGGTTQFTPVPASVAIAAMAQGQDLQVLPPFEQENLVIAAPSKAGIGDLRDLAGKRVAVAARGGAAETFATDVLAQHGVDAKGVTFVAAGAPATMAASLENGRIDAFVGSNSTLATLAQSTEMTKLASALDGTAGKRGEQGIASFYVTTPKYLQENRGTVDSFCRAVTRAATWIADGANRAGVLHYIQEWTGIKDPKAVEMLYETEHKTWMEQMDKERWKANVGFVASGKTISYDNVNTSCK